jgi:hypothetical protein
LWGFSIGGRGVLYRFLGVLSSNPSLPRGQLAGLLALVLLSEPLSLHMALVLLLLSEDLGSSLELLSSCLCSHLSLLFLLFLEIPGMCLSLLRGNQKVASLALLLGSESLPQATVLML